MYKNSHSFSENDMRKMYPTLQRKIAALQYIRYNLDCISEMRVGKPIMYATWELLNYASKIVLACIQFFRGLRGDTGYVSPGDPEIL